jgi:hypothetical protein
LLGESGSIGQPWLLRLPSSQKTNLVMAELDRLFPLISPPTSGWKYITRKIGWKLGFDLFSVKEPNSHSSILRQFLDAIRSGGPAPVTGEDGRRAVELCTAIYAAAITGDSVSLPIDSSHRFYEGIKHHDYGNSAIH